MVVHLVLTKALLGLSVPTTPPGSKAAVATAGSAKKGRVVPTAVSDATRPAVTTVASASWICWLTLVVNVDPRRKAARSRLGPRGRQVDTAPLNVLLQEWMEWMVHVSATLLWWSSTI